MKTLICAFGVLLMFAAFEGSAQTSPEAAQQRKPLLFHDLPSQFKITVADLDALFGLPLGATVNSRIAEGFAFAGTVISRSTEGQPYRTVVLRSTNRQGATLSLTKHTDASGNSRYSGRMLSFKNGDALDVVLTDGQYFFVKRNLRDLVAE